MSLVATYVKADDGYFYSNPILSTKDENWFICFDDDDPPELVIKVKSKLQPNDIIELLGLEAKVYEDGRLAGRIFGNNDDNFEFEDGRAYWIDIEKPIPAAYIMKHDGRYKKPQGQGAYYDFEGKI